MSGGKAKNCRLHDQQQIENYLNEYPWRDEFMKLDNSFVLNINICTFMNGPLWDSFCSLMKLSFNLIILTTLRPHNDLDPPSIPTPNQPVLSHVLDVSNRLKYHYCDIFNNLVRLQKIDSMDKMFFLISLASRKFFERAIIYHNDEQLKKKVQKHLDHYYESSIADLPEKQALKEGNNHLQIEKIVYMMLVHETTSNIVSPLTFQILKKKYIKKIIYQHNPNSHIMILQSLFHVRNQVSMKNVRIQPRFKHRPPLSDLQQEIKSFLKVDDGFELMKKRYRQKVVDNTVDILSYSLSELAKERDEQKRVLKQRSASETKNLPVASCNRGNKNISLKSLSVAAKVHYKLGDTEQQKCEYGRNRKFISQAVGTLPSLAHNNFKAQKMAVSRFQSHVPNRCSEWNKYQIQSQSKKEYMLMSKKRQANKSETINRQPLQATKSNMNLIENNLSQMRVEINQTKVQKFEAIHLPNQTKSTHEPWIQVENHRQPVQSIPNFCSNPAKHARNCQKLTAVRIERRKTPNLIRREIEQAQAGSLLRYKKKVSHKQIQKKKKELIKFQAQFDELTSARRGVLAEMTL